VDVFFDNVGGPILDDVLTRLARHARVVICGAVSQYNSESGPQGPKNYLSLLVTRSRMEGFVVFDYASRYPEAIEDLSIWLADGKIANLVDIEVALPVLTHPTRSRGRVGRPRQARLIPRQIPPRTDKIKGGIHQFS
jgi:NADPH-dependent curcumin reductase CurA